MIRTNHRKDTVWAKVGRSEYIRSDGVTIRKDAAKDWWYLYLPNGEHASTVHYDGTYDLNWKFGAPSLTWAKTSADLVTAETPAYQPL